MIVEITVVIIKNCNALLSLPFSMEINSINKAIVWQKERRDKRFDLSWFMSLKTCNARVRSGYTSFSSLFSIYPDTGSMLPDPANIKVQFIIFMVTGGGDW